jgi:hypothetical protein
MSGLHEAETRLRVERGLRVYWGSFRFIFVLALGVFIYASMRGGKGFV